MRTLMQRLGSVAVGGVVAIATLMMGGLTGVAQAAGSDVQIQALHNQECLMNQNWRIGSQIITRGCNGETRQRWGIRDLDGAGPGQLNEITNRYTDMCLTVSGASQNDWAQVVQANCSGDASQHWLLTQGEGGWQELKPEHSWKCLDISWGSAIQYGCNHGSNELFRYTSLP